MRNTKCNNFIKIPIVESLIRTNAQLVVSVKCVFSYKKLKFLKLYILAK